MDNFEPTESGPLNTLIKSALGFFGVIAAFKLLPKLLSFVTRRFVFGLLSEIIFVVLAGLLTEKLAEKLTGKEGSDIDAAGR